MEDESKQRRSLSWRVFKFLFVSACVVFSFVVVSFWTLGAYLEDDLPTITSLKEFEEQSPQLSRVFAADGTVLAEFWAERRTLVSAEEVPTFLFDAAVAAEDGNFYKHEGLDFWGMLRALYVNVRDGRFSQGGSTITQQVVRNFFLTRDKTLRRKMEELFLARKLERHLNKREILLLYLNQIYFGHGNYGISEAARFYLGKSVPDLSLSDAALLMSQVPSPENYNARKDPEGARKRRDRVLERMVKRDLITQEAYAVAVSTGLHLSKRPSTRELKADYFVEVVRRRLVETLGEERLLKGGLKIHTSLDPAVHRATKAALDDPKNRVPKEAQVAAVFMDPYTRGVLALVGGKNFKKHPFNRATQAKRQIGSTFKPVIFGAGMLRGHLSPESTYPNRLITYRGANGPWTPRNWDNIHDGNLITIAEALARSSNVVAVQALRDIGVHAMKSFAQSLGFNAVPPHDLSAALGSMEATPLDVTNAYATLASGGFRGQPVFITRVEDWKGNVVHSETSGADPSVPPLVARALTLMLQKAVSDGTGRPAYIPGLSVAGKTGTTNGNVDAWFVGYTEDIVGTIWVGHDRGKRLAGTSGPRTAAPLWRAVVKEVSSTPLPSDPF
jgi:penicillin-binding protein 1A